MPVQINEVIIRTVVDTHPSGSPDGERSSASATNTGCSEEDILERVLEIIQESKER